jgi:hypothetical protein
MTLSGFDLTALEPEAPPNYRLMVVLCPSIAANLRLLDRHSDPLPSDSGNSDLRVAALEIAGFHPSQSGDRWHDNVCFLSELLTRCKPASDETSVIVTRKDWPI